MKICQNKESSLTETEEGSIDAGRQLKPFHPNELQCLIQIQLLKLHVTCPGTHLRTAEKQVQGH